MIQHQVDKKIEHEVETGVTYWFIRFRLKALLGEISRHETCVEYRRFTWILEGLHNKRDHNKLKDVT